MHTDECPVPGMVAVWPPMNSSRLMWLVRAIAKKALAKLPCQVGLNDVVEDGVFGLMAVQRYDAARGVSFPLYAKHRIHGAIDHLSRDLRSKVKKAESSARENEPGLAHGPSEALAMRVSRESDLCGTLVLTRESKMEIPAEFSVGPGTKNGGAVR